MLLRIFRYRTYFNINNYAALKNQQFFSFNHFLIVTSIFYIQEILSYSFYNQIQEFQSMQISLDQYIRNFRIFYQQLVKGHNKQQQLNKQFKLLIDSELKKWKRSYGVSKISETSQNPLLNKLRENRKNKEQSKISIDALYNSNKIQHCVVYGYLYLVFQCKNSAAYEYINQRVQQSLNNKEAFTAPTLRRMNFAWSKFDQMINGKRKIVRFDKQLQQYYKQLPPTFLDVLYKIITHEKIFIVQNKTLYFEQLSKYLSLKIEYFEISENQNIKVTSYGENQWYPIKLGFIKSQNSYVNVNKLPQKQQKQVNKEITLQKFGQISSHLNQMYTLNMRQYLNLSNIKHKMDSNRLNESRSSELRDSRNHNQLEMNSQFGAI